jgi:hypothetical protein
MAHGWKWSGAVAALVLLVPSATSAQEEAKAEAQGSGFGVRDSFVLSHEQDLRVANGCLTTGFSVLF